jgi:hypoxanthine-DNA glycosylase
MAGNTYIHPFEPILFSDTHTLILGSFPSIKSFENDFYYSHPRNQFWNIMSSITGYPAISKDQRIWLLKKSGIGLWDMIAACSRDNSLDSSLEDEEVNDIPDLLERFPSITKIAFTGRKAEALWKLHYDYIDIETRYLPSPSPAYAKMNLEEKMIKWKELLDLDMGAA